MALSGKKQIAWLEGEGGGIVILLSHPLEILGPKTKTPGNSTFLITSGNSTLSLINVKKFLLQFLQYPLEFHILNPPVCFFLEYPNEGML